VWSFVILVVLAIGGTAFGFWQAGYRPYVVHTGSMVPTYNPGDLVIDGPAGNDHLAGQVITFRHSADPNDLVTHRITDVTNGLIHTKGDANRSADVWNIKPDMVVGTVSAAVPGLGYAVVFLQQPTGIAALVTAAISIFLLWTLFFPAQPTPARSAPDSTEPTSEMDTEESAAEPDTGGVSAGKSASGGSTRSLALTSTA
jgi:signal peptidase